MYLIKKYKINKLLLFVLLITFNLLSNVKGQEYLDQVIERLNSIEKDLSEVQRLTYKKNPSSEAGTKEVTSSSSESNSNSIIADHEKRLMDLEENIRMLNGTLEEVVYKIEKLSTQINQLYENNSTISINKELSFSPPLSSPELNIISKNSSIITESNKLLNDTDSKEKEVLLNQDTTKNQILPDPNIKDNPSMKVLGIINTESSNKSELPTIPNQTENSDLSPEKNATLSSKKNASSNLIQVKPSMAYQIAYDLLARAEYVEAEKAFKAFLGEHPKNPLCSNAYYWLGETYYVRKKFSSAAVSFAKGYQNFPQGIKAADQLLKLAMTFVNLGKNDDACATFAKLETEFPNAPKRITKRSKEFSQRAECL